MRSCILTYHSIDGTGSVISVSPAVFAEQMKLLAGGSRPVVPLERVFDVPGSIALTFDDGFANFHRFALPALHEYGFPATVFVVSGYVGKSNTWRQPAHIPTEPLMTWDLIRECSDAGIAIGCHTVSHPRLPDLAPQSIEAEIRDSKHEIEQHVGKPVEQFAYPYGAVSQTCRQSAGRHFRLACGTDLAFVRSQVDPLCLPRLDTYYLRDLQWFGRVSGGAGGLYISARAALRHVASAIRTS